MSFAEKVKRRRGDGVGICGGEERQKRSENHHTTSSLYPILSLSLFLSLSLSLSPPSLSVSLPPSLPPSLSPLPLCFQTGTSLLGWRRCGLGCSGRNNEPLIEG